MILNSFLLITLLTKLISSHTVRLISNGNCLKITSKNTLKLETDCENLKSSWFVTTNGHLKSASSGECLSSDLNLSHDCSININLWSCQNSKLKSTDTVG